MTSHTINSFFSKMDTLATGTDESFLQRIATSWRGHMTSRMIRELLYRWLEKSADSNKLIAGARETSTHYVWPIYQNSKGYAIALNEFKDPGDILGGYATTLHNHRYSFVSLILSGGYHQVRSDVQVLDLHRAARIWNLGEDAVVEGDIVSVNHTEFHRLSTICPGTVTLVVKCPAAKAESLSVDTNTLRVTAHVPVEARVRQLMDSLLPANELRR